MSAVPWLASNFLATTVVLGVGAFGALAVRRHPAWENALWRAALLLVLILPLALAAAELWPAPRGPRLTWTGLADRWEFLPAAPLPAPLAATPETEKPPAPRPVAPSPARLDERSFLDALLLLWIVGMGVSCGGLALGMARVRRLVRSSRPLISPEAGRRLGACVRISAVGSPALRAAEGLSSPVLVGWRRPCILVPDRASVPSREVLLHELAHLKRADLWWLTLGRIAGAVWWFHPLMWRAVRRLERSAEHVCDDLVLTWTDDAPGYAAQLVAFARLAPSARRFALAGVAVTGFRSGLGQRVARLLEAGRARRVSIGRGGVASLTAAGATLLALLVAADPGRGQSTPPPPPPAAHVISAIQVVPTGGAVVPEAEAVAVSGLRVGGKYDDPTAQEAERRLWTTQRTDTVRVSGAPDGGTGWRVRIEYTPATLRRPVAATSLEPAADGTPPAGVAASVNGVPIMVAQVRELIGPRERALQAEWHDKVPPDRLNAIWHDALQDLIDRELILQAFASRSYQLPASILDDRVNRIVEEEFGGDHAGFVATLRVQGYTEESFRWAERDKVVVQAMRHRFVSQPLEENELLKGQEASAAERERMQDAWLKTLRAPANIRVFVATFPAS